MKIVDKFIKFFSAIPEDKWCVSDFKNEKGQCCVLGFLGMNEDNMYDSKNYPKEAGLLVSLFSKHLDGAWPANINNGYHRDFPQKTAKGRVLAALRKIKKLQVK